MTNKVVLGFGCFLCTIASVLLFRSYDSSDCEIAAVALSIFISLMFVIIGAFAGAAITGKLSKASRAITSTIVLGLFLLWAATAFRDSETAWIMPFYVTGAALISAAYFTRQYAKFEEEKGKEAANLLPK